MKMTNREKLKQAFPNADFEICNCICGLDGIDEEIGYCHRFKNRSCDDCQNAWLDSEYKGQVSGNDA